MHLSHCRRLGILVSVLLVVYSALCFGILGRWWRFIVVHDKQINSQTDKNRQIDRIMKYDRENRTTSTSLVDNKPIQRHAIPTKNISTMSATERLSIRRDSVRKNCVRYQRSLTATEKRILYAHLVVDEKNKVIWCPVRKAGTTTWRIVMLILMGKFTNVSAALDHVLHHDFKFMTRLSLQHYSKEAIEYRLKHYTKFMAYREPFGRIVSDYRQIKLYNTGFRKGICKAVVSYNNRNLKGNRPAQESNPDAWKNISFSHFVNFVTQFSGNRKKYQDLDGHWKPTNLICHPCHVDYDYLVDLDSPDVVEESAHVVKALGAPSWLRVPQENRSGNETNTTTTTRYLATNMSIKPLDSAV
ncbi:carbohydrate sulfotransferase 11-like isoform X2 [Corticium candelabrum]|uniref:carbohydrate sulfotransferase 11-like isoform X2 n=1 Tax=Corticium candelabrum TaxID=121492 RepID=UPI002E2766AB|nr:carbohydrate sulfotransferase 11-like isoform X2 [Corticium candelabrum]